MINLDFGCFLLCKKKSLFLCHKNIKSKLLFDYTGHKNIFILSTLFAISHYTPTIPIFFDNHQTDVCHFPANFRWLFQRTFAYINFTIRFVYNFICEKFVIKSNSKLLLLSQEINFVFGSIGKFYYLFSTIKILKK